jgi:hypothetical protein
MAIKTMPMLPKPSPLERLLTAMSKFPGLVCFRADQHAQGRRLRHVLLTLQVDES